MVVLKLLYRAVFLWVFKSGCESECLDKILVSLCLVWGQCATWQKCTANPTICQLFDKLRQFTGTADDNLFLLVDIVYKFYDSNMKQIWHILPCYYTGCLSWYYKCGTYHQSFTDLFRLNIFLTLVNIYLFLSQLRATFQLSRGGNAWSQVYKQSHKLSP